MAAFTQKIRRSLVSKLILSVGFILLLTISTWSYFSIAYQKESLLNEVVSQTDRLSNTIKLGTHYAMMLNSRDDINQIITNIARLKEIQNIRIYNKEGAIKFSKRPEVREKIFDLFYSSKGRAGTGLGLFITRQVVRQHGGSIEVESEPGQGSGFTVRWPRRMTRPAPDSS